MNSMALGILLHILNGSGLVWPALKLQLKSWYTVKVAISPEMEVLDPSKSIPKFEFSKSTFFERIQFLLQNVMSFYL